MKLKLLNNRVLDNYLWNDSFFDNFFEEAAQDGGWFDEVDDGYKLTLNIAGYKKKQIKMSVEGKLLHVKAEQEDRKFHRAFAIPDKADKSLINAKYEDGLLKIVINKNAEEKSIDIKVG